MMRNFEIDANHDDLAEHVETASPTGDIRHGVSQVLRDVVTLGELQTELLQVDLRNFLTTHVIPTVVLGVVAIVSALASLPILLASLAYFLVEVANLTVASAFLAAAGVGLLVAAICGGIAWQRFHSQRDAFARSRIELARNVRWLKQVLGRPTETADHLNPTAAYRPPR
jgi:hypothetical protein